MKFLEKISILFMVVMFSCQQENKSVDIYSYNIISKDEKFQTLKKYLNKTAGIKDVEYHIWYKDNSKGLVPGPSDYTIKLALKIETDSIDSWLNNLEPSNKKISIEHWSHIKLDKSKWELNSEPQLYHSRNYNEIKLVFKMENIILAIYSTMPIATDTFKY